VEALYNNTMRLVPKNKTGGVVTNTVMGVGGLIIAVIVIFVIVSTVMTADLLGNAALDTTRLNQVVGPVNFSGVSFGNSTLPSASCTANIVANNTDGVVISSTNYTVSGCTIAFLETGNTDFNNTFWKINSTTSYLGNTSAEVSARDMEGQFYIGVDNISTKIPTILLIVAVVFLFGALVLLIKNAKEMGIGEGSSL